MTSGYLPPEKLMVTNNRPVLVTPPNAFPATIATANSWNSGVMPLFLYNKYLSAATGYSVVTAAMKSTQVLTLTVQCYMDEDRLIPVGAASTVVTTANVAAYVSANLPALNFAALYFDIAAANASGSTATISGAAIAMASY